MDAMFAFLLFVCIIALFFYKFAARQLPDIPGPPWTFWLGHLPALKNNVHRLFQWHVEISEKCGRTWQLCIPGGVKLKLVDGECVEHILRHKVDNYIKVLRRHDQDVFQELTGRDGFLISQGDQWRHFRKTASHMFSAKVLNQHMAQCFIKNGHILLERLGELKKGESIDMQDMFFRFTMDSFCEIAFNHSFCGLKEKEEPAFSKAFDRMSHRVFIRRSIEPEFVFRLKQLLNTADEKQMKIDQKTVDDFLYEVIAARKKDLDLSSKKFEGDIISFFVTRAKDNGEEMPSDLYLRNLCMNLIIAGRDTTGAILTSIFQQLSKHPEVEQKLIDEIDTVLQGEEPTAESVNKLKYCTAVFDETLRIYPSAPMDYRKCLNDDVLPDGTHVPAGCEVHYLAWQLGRQKKYFPEPEKFDPERFLREDSDKLPKPWSSEWPAFNAGLRSCLGRQMSYMETKIVVAMVLQKCRLKLVPGQKLHDYELGLTLVREHGQLMTLIPRVLPN